MLKILEYLFVKIYVFYRDVMRVNRYTQFYAIFIVSLILVANVSVIGIIISALVFKKVSLRSNLQLFIGMGNVIMFSLFFLVHHKKRYARLVCKFEDLSYDDRIKLDTRISLYILISILGLIAVMTL